jgi:hypothetical protein
MWQYQRLQTNLGQWKGEEPEFEPSELNLGSGKEVKWSHVQIILLDPGRKVSPYEIIHSWVLMNSLE